MQILLITNGIKIFLKKNKGPIFVMENHFTFNGFFSYLCQCFIKNKIGLDRDIYNLGFDDVPACGTNREVLSHHNLDIQSIYNMRDVFIIFILI